VFVAGERGDVVVLSDRYWRERFQADRAVIGRTMTIRNHPFEIVGVAAKGLHGVLLDWGDRPQLWIPFEAYRDASSAFAGYDLARMDQAAAAALLRGWSADGTGRRNRVLELGDGHRLEV